jgi:hypothetical protein
MRGVRRDPQPKRAVQRLNGGGLCQRRRHWRLTQLKI